MTAIVRGMLHPMERGRRIALGRLLAAATAGAGRPEGAPGLDALVVAAAPQDEVVAAAAYHRIQGCVHESLQHVDGVERAVLDQLSAARSQAVLDHLVRIRALDRFGMVMDAAGIPWLVMKGVAVATLLYRDPGLRTAIDIDVLVSPSRFADAIEAMERAGYRHLVRNWRRVREVGAGELPLTDGDVTFDVHWHVLNFGRNNAHIQTDALLERSQEMVIGGRQLRTLEPTDTLFHLAVHATKSGADRLVWLKDIERSLAVGQPDLDGLVRRSRDANRAPMVAVALQRAESTLGAPLPEGFVDTLAGRTTSALDRLVTRVDPPERAHERPSISGLLARTTSSGPTASVMNLGWIAFDRIRIALAPRGAADGDESGHVLAKPIGDDQDKQAFLDSIVPTDRYVTDRVHHRDGLVRLLAPHEPRTTNGIIDLGGRGLRRWNARAWTVRRGDDVVAAVVARRTGFDSWYATCFMDDPDAAATVAAIVDRSPAVAVGGSGVDAGPLVDYLRRRTSVSVVPWLTVPHPAHATDATDDGVREATKEDLDALVELYRHTSWRGSRRCHSSAAGSARCWSMNASSW